MNISAISAALARTGLTLRGGFNFSARDNAPNGPGARPAKSILLIGNGGGAMWPHFKRWLTAQPVVRANPLDSWSKEVIARIAEEAGAWAVFPGDKPCLPFQQWAARAEGLKSSPLGILMHPRYGLWHAYRGALLFDHEKSIQEPRGEIHHCDLCAEKPCLFSCPVDAFGSRGFSAEACYGHISGPDGLTCMDQGCQARKACPVAIEHQYPDDQQSFHMAALRHARARK